MEEKIETHRITTRGYELSSRGFIGTAQFLRYFEHSRWMTISRSSKIPVRTFWMIGVVRAQTLEIRQELGFDVEIETSTWMSRLGKTSVSFSHDMHRVDNGALIARSTATIVALDQDRRPKLISDEAARYLVDRPSLAVERLDVAVPEDAWKRSVDIRPSDQDLQQHVNHARYMDFVEDTRWFGAQGGAYGKGEWDGAPSRATIAYEREARVGDPMVVHTWRPPEKERALEFALFKDPTTLAARARIELR